MARGDRDEDIFSEMSEGSEGSEDSFLVAGGSEALNKFIENKTDENFQNFLNLLDYIDLIKNHSQQGVITPIINNVGIFDEEQVARMIASGLAQRLNKTHLEDRLQALLNNPETGTLRQFTDDQVARMIASGLDHLLH